MMMDDRRGVQRKPLKAKALMAVDGGSPVWLRTVDISSNGIGIAADEPLPVGVAARVRFEMFYEGRSHVVDVKGRIAYCIFSGGEFKAGFTFSLLDLPTMTLITKYIR